MKNEQSKIQSTLPVTNGKVIHIKLVMGLVLKQIENEIKKGTK